MQRSIAFLFVLVVAAAASGVWIAVQGLSDGKGNAPLSLEERVRQYLIANPEVLNEAADAFQRRRAKERAAEVQKTLLAVKEHLRNPKDLPVLGNPNGDVTVVEFFDYRCPYCKRTWAELEKLVEADPNLRLVFKEFPILSPESLFASRAAIAAREQGKYIAFHRALMTYEGEFTTDAVIEVARDLGLDIERLRSDMEKPVVEAIIGESHALASKLGIEATPTLVIGDKIHAGYADLATFQDLVKRARSGCKTC